MEMNDSLLVDFRLSKVGYTTVHLYTQFSNAIGAKMALWHNVNRKPYRKPPTISLLPPECKPPPPCVSPQTILTLKPFQILYEPKSARVYTHKPFQIVFVMF